MEAAMNDPHALGIYSEVPLLDKVQSFLGRALYVLFGNPTANLLWDLLFIVVAAFVFTHELRANAENTLVEALVIVIFIVVFLIWGSILGKYIFPRFSAAVFGQPVFGKIGGMQTRLFFTALKCSDAIQFEFDKGDLKVIKQLSDIDSDLTQDLLKIKYREIAGLEGEANQAALEKKWKKVWKDQILKVSTREPSGRVLAFADFISTTNFAARIEPIKIQAVMNLILPIMLLFQTVMLLLIFNYLEANIALITVIQGGLAMSFIISSLLFSFHSHQNTEISIIGSVAPFPPEIEKQYTERLEKLVDKKLHPIKVTVKKHYLSVIRDFFALPLFWIGCVLNAFTCLLLLGLTVLIGFLWFGAGMVNLLPWYRDLAVAFLLVPLGFLAAYYISFLTLQHARLLVAPVIIGLLAAVLPFLISYLFTGQIDFSQAQNSIIAAGTAIVSGIVAAITAQVKSAIEGKAA
jgi:hypothetical protein